MRAVRAATVARAVTPMPRPGLAELAVSVATVVWAAMAATLVATLAPAGSLVAPAVLVARQAQVDYRVLARVAMARTLRV